MSKSNKEINEMLKATRGQKFRKQTQNEIDRINTLKAVNSELAKDPDWQRKNQEGQDRRKESGWNKKMIGNKNSLGKKNRLGMTNSEESNKKRSEALMGIERHNLRGVPKPKITCPHCGKEGGKPQMIQYHFDNCKFKPQ